MANKLASGKSPYWNQISVASEQDLLLSFSQEVISQMGVVVKYIPNPYTSVDPIFQEDRMPDLSKATEIVVYVNNASNPLEGDPIFSKFGFWNKQQISFSVSIKQWKEIFPTARPMEGDLLYLPLSEEFGPDDFFKVTFVDKYEVGGFFPLGKHHTFELQCERWAYSSEHVNTDDLEANVTAGGHTLDTVFDPNMDNSRDGINDAIEERADSILDFSESNPFGNV